MTTAVTSQALGELRPILELVPSPLNPRKSFDKAKLEELAASIASKGIIEPLIVRERAGLAQLEIVAGERRYRAAKLVKHDLVPVIIRHLSDVEVLELMAIENSQRDDLHPLEEADGYAALMKADPAYTPKAIAAKIGKSERYVQQRLQLATLEADVKKAFLANHITAGHAELICRLKPDDQKAALKACFHNLYGEDKERGCVSIRVLHTWIDQNVRLHLAADDPQTQLFPEVLKAVEKAADPSTIVQVAGSWIPEDARKKMGALSSDQYRQVQGKKDTCPHAQRAVIVIGTDRGKFVEICTARTECKLHWRWEIERAARESKERKARAKGQPAPKPSKKAAAAEEKRKATNVIRERRNAAIGLAGKQLQKAKVTPGPALQKLIASFYEFTGVKTWADVAAKVVETGDIHAYTDNDWKRAIALLKPFGIELEAIERELAAKAEPQASASAKKAGKAKVA